MEMLARMPCRHKLQSLMLNTKKTFFSNFQQGIASNRGGQQLYVLFSDFSNVQQSPTKWGSTAVMFCSRTFLSDHNSLFNDGNYFFHTNLMKNDFSAKYFKDPFPQGGYGEGHARLFWNREKESKNHFTLPL